MPNAPKLTKDATKSYAEDRKLFRIGAVKSWAEFGKIKGKVPLVSVSLMFTDSGLPTSQIDVCAGSPFGSMSRDENFATYKFTDLKKFDQVSLFLEIPDTVLPEEDIIGPALDPGKYLMFSGLVSNIATTIDRESGIYVARLTLAHEVSTSLSVGTLLFGSYGPYTYTHMYERRQLMDNAQGDKKAGGERESNIIGSGGNAQGNDMMSDWLLPAFKHYYKPEMLPDTTKPKLAIFEQFSQAAFARMSQAISKITGSLPVKETPGRLLRSNLYGQINEAILSPGTIDNTSALPLLYELSKSFSFNVMPRPDSILITPYWPFRKLEDMLVLEGGVNVSIEDIQSVMTTRGSVVGGMVLVSEIGPQHSSDAALLGSSIIASYALEFGSDDLSKSYVTVDQETIPEFLLQTHANEPDSDGVPVTVTSALNPGDSSTETGNSDYGKTVSSTIADGYARYRTWESWLGPNVVSMALPLRLDIVPGKVVRVDNRITYENDKLTPQEAIYGYIKSVTVTISAASNSAGLGVSLSHVHTYSDQLVLENGGDEPILYDKSALKVIDDLQLFNKV